MTDKTRMQFIQMERAYYRDNIHRDTEDEISITKAHVDGGCEWEFSVAWYALGGKSVPRLEIYEDAWIAFAQIPKLFEMLREYDVSKDDGKPSLTPQKLCEELLEMGFADATPEHPPGVGEKPTFDEKRSAWRNVPRQTTVTDKWTVLVLDNGRKFLTFGEDYSLEESVHVLNECDIEEYACSDLEWREAPQGVMGAILRLAGGAKPASKDE